MHLQVLLVPQDHYKKEHHTNDHEYKGSLELKHHFDQDISKKKRVT